MSDITEKQNTTRVQTGEVGGDTAAQTEPPAPRGRPDAACGPWG